MMASGCKTTQEQFVLQYGLFFSYAVCAIPSYTRVVAASMLGMPCNLHSVPRAKSLKNQS